jgi:putative hydroxymethylpyrimidine transport system ATP-binding protein
MPSLSNARLLYHQKLIFDDLNFSLAENQWTCILGPSGSGKSSLLRLIARLPIDGQAQSSCTILPEDIAYMAQTDLLLPWLTVLDNLFIGFRLRREKISAQQKSEALHLLEKIGISKLAYQKPHQLSGGERQRAALARTLFEHKKIILMDEPFSALDAITKWKLQALAADYLSHKTVLLVTHDPLEALRLGHQIYVLAGSPATLEDPIILHSPAPRDIQDRHIQKAYTLLMHKLEKAQLCGG